MAVGAPAYATSAGAVTKAATNVTGSVAEQTALAQAAETGEPVEITAARTEYATTEANPDGSFTLTQSTAPQRVRAGDGLWQNVDTTLVHRSNGSVGPKASVVDLAFTGGGSGKDMIRLGSKQGSVSLAWPGALPEPTIDGATATYADVMAGVDLELTATAEGYHEVLVVKSAAAAASPALEQVTLSASGQGLQVVPGAGGGLRAVDENGNTVFKGPAGQMWDSAGDQAAAPQSARATAVDDPQDPAGEGDPTQPGVGDTTAVLPVQVDGEAVSVTPDLDLLRGAGTVYPVRIDPSVGLDVSERSVISSDGDRWWQFNGEYGVGLCGNADGYYCGNGYKNRMLFELAPTQLAGKYVLDATFRAHETWSFNCDAHWVDLERTDNMSEGTHWPGPKDLDQMGDRFVSYGRGDNCSPSQPDSWVEFNDNPDEPDENLKSTVRSFADGKISRLTFMLRAKDETDARAWKRFDDNAELKVNYVHRPGTPTSVGVIPGNGNTAYCRSSSTDPLMVTRADPMVQATVQTKVEAHLGDEEGSLQAEYIVERGDDAPWHEVWSDYRPASGWVPDGTLQSLRTSNRADGGLYRLKARTQSHWSYDGASGDLFSSYSSWCYFKIDSTAPKAPTITAGSPYTACTVDLCEGKGGPGTPGSFTFTPNAADTDVKAYRWRLLTTSAKDTKQVSGSTVTVPDVTPSTTGTQVLSVEASDLKLDTAGRTRWGTPAEFAFKVSPASGPVGRWHLDDGAPGSGIMTAKDSATEAGARHDATLVGVDGTGWSGRGRRGDPDYSLRLNDTATDPADQVGHAATASAALNTKDSFTVSAWAQLSNPSANRVVLSEPGANNSAFTLYYSSSFKQWIFNRADRDLANPTFIRSLADQTNPPLNVWTHLAGVFDTKGDTDKSNDTIQLFVNGRPQGKPVTLATSASTYDPWTANEGLQMGRSKVSGAYGEYFFGLVDEVTVWQRPLTGDEIIEEARAAVDGVPTNDLVAHWDAATATSTVIPESTVTPYAPGSLKLAGGAAPNADGSAVLLNGTTAYASVAGPVVDEGGSFTVSASVEVDSEALGAKPVGYTGQVAGQRTGNESAWALWIMKPADGAYQWKFTRTVLGSDGKVDQSAEVLDFDLAETDTWVQVTGVFDAQEAVELTDSDGVSKISYGKLHLFIGGDDKPSGENAAFPDAQPGSGELAIGRGGQDGAIGNYLPGGLQDLRVWTGAMTADQVSSQVLPTSDTG
ncbi:LamG domain-containing protein [Streptomyces sp. PA03-2a]|uniref:LamG domain-containing protein n=1 Tax=Streptomyces sp. PA03-2a TaxID=3028701 RepID=UPI0029A28DC1|nr:LamG domain-containing protein [Streptomyces sp. PA03-2a]MDX2730988.1 LamG domain-containing protein [Streptomyces sp. PA03-2a]